MLFQAPPPVAFVDVAVLTMERPGVLEHQTVLVKDGRVSWIGPANQARPPKAYRVIDGRGQYLLPAFSDLHTHPRRPLDLVTYLTNGITTIRVMWGGTNTLGWRRDIATGKLAGPRIVTSGAIIDGNPPSQPSMIVLTDPAKTRAEVTAQHLAGSISSRSTTASPSLDRAPSWLRRGVGAEGRGGAARRDTPVPDRGVELHRPVADSELGGGVSRPGRDSRDGGGRAGGRSPAGRGQSAAIVRQLEGPARGHGPGPVVPYRSMSRASQWRTLRTN